MDSVVVKNAIGSIDKLLSKAREALWDITFGQFGHGLQPPQDGGLVPRSGGVLARSKRR
jgi:hypothetical protein